MSKLMEQMVSSAHDLVTQKAVKPYPTMSQFLTELKEKREVIFSNQKQGQLSLKELSKDTSCYKTVGAIQAVNKVPKPPRFRESEV